VRKICWKERSTRLFYHRCSYKERGEGEAMEEEGGLSLLMIDAIFSFRDKFQSQLDLVEGFMKLALVEERRSLFRIYMHYCESVVGYFTCRV